MSNDAPLIRTGQGSYVRDVYGTRRGGRRDAADVHGRVDDRLAHAAGSAALICTTIDDFASELHPDVVANYLNIIATYAAVRIAQQEPAEQGGRA